MDSHEISIHDSKTHKLIEGTNYSSDSDTRSKQSLIRRIYNTNEIEVRRVYDIFEEVYKGKWNRISGFDKTLFNNPSYQKSIRNCLIYPNMFHKVVNTRSRSAYCPWPRHSRNQNFHSWPNEHPNSPARNLSSQPCKTSHTRPKKRPQDLLSINS